MAKLYKLPNGMEVLLEENHAAPVIAFHILVKVGSAMEKKDEAGICHLIEHMLFKGTPSMAVGEIAKEVEGAGGEINAYTSFDQTVYFINMAKKFSDKGLAILADVVQNPLFDKTELAREKEVVLEEIRRSIDNPSHRTSDLLFCNSFKRHPYKNPIIGSEKTVKSFSRKKILDFYKKWYTPENMTFVIVGDFNSTTMLGKLKKTFKCFKGKKPPKVTLPPEPKSKKLTMIVEENPIYATYFSFGFHIPEITNNDIPALDVLSHILAGADSSRLEQVIKEEKQLVNAVYSYAFTPKHPGIFIVGGLTSPEKVTDAIIAITDEIRKLHSTPLGNEEIARAKLNIRSGEIYEKETVGGQAGKYAYFVATAETHLFEQEYYTNLQSVHADDIKRVAQKYLRPENATLIVVPPKGGLKVINTGKIKRHISKLKPTKKSAKILKKHVAPPVIHKLSNGITLVLRENHTLPIVTCCAAVNGGLRFENKKNNGINNMIAQTITKGTQNKSAIQIAEAIESIAGGIAGFSGRNTLGVKAEFLSDNFNKGFDLFAEVLTEPSFTKDELERERLQVLDAIKNQEDALTALTFIKFLASMFPDHPYGLKVLGEKKTVKKFQRKDLTDYYWKMMSPKRMVVSVVGDISPEEVIKDAKTKLKFKKSSSKVLKVPAAQRPAKKEIVVEYKCPEKEQAHIVTGFLGPSFKSKDHYAAAVLNNILSGQGGRLFLNLRDKMSLAYAINSSYFAGPEPGYLAIYIGTEASKLKTALGGIKKELEQLVRKGVGQEELIRAKNHIVGSHALERQRNSAMATSYAFNLLFGLGMDEVDKFPKKISAVTTGDVLRVIKKYMKLDKLVTSIVRPI